MNKSESTKDKSKSRHKMLERILWLLGGLFIGVGASAIIFSSASYLSSEGTVNGVEISKAEVREYIEARRGNLVMQYVKDRVQVDALKQLGVTVTKDEIKAEVDKKIQEYGSQEDFEKSLATDGYSMSQYEYTVGKTLLSDKASEYFVSKRNVEYDDVAKTFNDRVNSGKEIALMDCKVIELTGEENAETLKFDELDQSRVKDETGIQTNVMFTRIPDVGTEAITTIENKRIIVKVVAVYKGLEDGKVYDYIKEMIKAERGNKEYEEYIKNYMGETKIVLKGNKNK